ncbi:MAG: FHA domain-containing protein [Actinomycetota bacterium]
MPALIVLDGPLAGLRVQVVEEVVIGRGAASLTLPDPEVSRHHASVRPADGGLVVEDLGSMNGTWVDGRRLTGPARLAAGSTLRVGDTALGVELAGPPVPPEPQPAASATAPTAAPPPGLFRPPSHLVRRSMATRSETAVILTFAAIGMTAILLILYFAFR